MRLRNPFRLHYGWYSKPTLPFFALLCFFCFAFFGFVLGEACPPLKLCYVSDTNYYTHLLLCMFLLVVSERYYPCASVLGHVITFYCCCVVKARVSFLSQSFLVTDLEPRATERIYLFFFVLVFVFCVER